MTSTRRTLPVRPARHLRTGVGKCVGPLTNTTSAPASAQACESVTHLAAGVVGDHRTGSIASLRRAGGDQYALAEQGFGCAQASSAAMISAGSEHAAVARFTAGLIAVAGADDARRRP